LVADFSSWWRKSSGIRIVNCVELFAYGPAGFLPAPGFLFSFKDIS